MAYLKSRLTDVARLDAVTKLESIAAELGCNVAQLAIAWVAKNPHVSTVITGASRLDQLKNNLGAVDVIAKLTPEVKKRVESLTRKLAQ